MATGILEAAEASTVRAKKTPDFSAATRSRTKSESGFAVPRENDTRQTAAANHRRANARAQEPARSASKPNNRAANANDGRAEESWNKNDAFADQSFREVFHSVVAAMEQSKNPAPALLAEVTNDDVPDQDALAGLAQFLPALSADQQEAMERLTLIAADGGLDVKLLAELDETALNELAQWLENGANGLFPGAEELTSGESPASALAESAVSALQLAQLRDRLAAAPARETALVGDLIKLNEMSALDIDKLAQSILRVLPNENSAADLRQLLQNTPTDELTAAMRDALAAVAPESAAPLDDLPEVVLKSLAIEVINVNNAEVDAAEKQRALLEGLNNNAKLRAEMINRVAGAAPEKLSAAVNGEKLAGQIAAAEVTEELLTAETPVKIETGTEVETIDLDGAELDEKFSGLLTAENKKNAPKAAITGAPTPIAEKAKTAETPAPIANDFITPDDETTLAEKFFLADDDPDTNEVKTSAAKINDAQNLIADFHKFSGAEIPVPTADEEGVAPISHLAAPTFGEQFSAVNHGDNAAIKNETTSRQAVLQDNINRLAELIDVSRAATAQTLKSLTLALNPPELGKVTVELELSASGGVSATIKAENDAARTLLMSGLDSLRKTLEAKGVSLEQCNVELGNQDAASQENYDRQSRANGGDWFGAMNDERDRRARHAANQIDGRRGNPGAANSADDEDVSEISRIRAGSSFELIA